MTVHQVAEESNAYLEVWCCGDCAAALVNGDWTGHDDELLDSVAASVELIFSINDHLEPSGYFRCWCCSADSIGGHVARVRDH